MLQQSNNTVEFDKTRYTLASSAKALNSIEDLPDVREVNTTGVNLQHQVVIRRPCTPKICLKWILYLHP
jgi:hypothetical protein